MATLDDWLAEARRVVPLASADDVEAWIRDGSAVILDVREPDEWTTGTLPGAVRIPRGLVEMEIGQRVHDRGTRIVTYCAAGTRALLTARTLRDLGYVNAHALAVGMRQWRQEGRPLDAPTPAPAFADAPAVAPLDRARYARHLELPEVGEAGQTRLRTSRVLLVGAGGLGSPAALYLAAAGVGSLGLVDPDVVDVTNLQRQVLHTTDRIGMRKVDSGRVAIAALNPDVTVVTHPERFDAASADRLLAGYDAVLDGSDDFATRYALNDACVRLGVPLVHGSVFRFDGQVTTIVPGGPCYRCLYPEAPSPGFAPSCRETGVLGVVPGVIGMLQATEVLKLLLGLGEPLRGRLLVYDAKSARIREIGYARAPGCAACRAARGG